ncbi:trypsin-like serine peptidase [Actinocrispum wychmicini]|uniref:Trypsin n=1 Tax=Actinocrispum wychmicini TaxID=1213861 RepID=A0A4R2JMZ1_9PSEU|nr:hypothetical protein [Actinocrispum wychmicini]TCO60674.1 hypothetical protein EV192_103249 [Actinocrispum wychmicini]
MGWSDYGDPDYDLAFVTLRPNSHGKIGELVGQNGIVVNSGYLNDRTLLQLRGAVPGTPERCDGQTEAISLFDLRVQLDGCTVINGSSGSPWFANYDGHLGQINGVTAGARSDNDAPVTIYFDDMVWDLWTGFKGAS